MTDNSQVLPFKNSEWNRNQIFWLSHKWVTETILEVAQSKISRGKVLFILRKMLLRVL